MTITKILVMVFFIHQKEREMRKRKFGTAGTVDKVLSQDNGFQEWKKANPGIVNRSGEYPYSIEERECCLYALYMWDLNTKSEKKFVQKNLERIILEFMDLNSAVREYVSKYSQVPHNDNFWVEFRGILQPLSKKRKYKTNFLLLISFLKLQNAYINKALYIQNSLNVVVERFNELDEDLQKDLYEKTAAFVSTDRDEWLRLIPFYEYIKSRFLYQTDTKVIEHIRKMVGKKNLKYKSAEKALQRYKQKKNLMRSK